LIQYRQSYLSLPPPLPPPPLANETAPTVQLQPKPQEPLKAPLSSLVSGYDSDSDEEEEEGKAETPAQAVQDQTEAVQDQTEAAQDQTEAVLVETESVLVETKVVEEEKEAANEAFREETEAVVDETDVVAEDVEADPEFIGPKIPTTKEPSPPGTDDELVADVETAVPEDLQEGATPPPDQVLPGPPPQQTEKEQEGLFGDETITEGLADILSKLDAEQPPDYQLNGHVNEATPPLVATPPLQAPSGPPQQAPTGPPVPHPSAPPPQSSISQLLTSYSDSDQSDTEQEDLVVVKPVMKRVTGQLDSSGRIHFTSNNFQTEEQRASLAGYQAQETKFVAGPAKAVKEVAVNSRKRRIALPGGRFNKSSEVEAAPVPEQPQNNSNLDLKSKYAVQFVKSKTVLPGSMKGEEEDMVEEKEMDEQKEVEKEKKKRKKREDPEERAKRLLAAGPQLPPPRDESSIVGLSEDELAEELVEKLEFFKVGEQKISSLKLLAVKIETLYSAWTAGALNPKYLKIFLENAHKRIKLVESMELVSGSWTYRWDRYSPFSILGVPLHLVF